MILVTGASGTIGAHVVRQLRERGHGVRAMTRSRGRIPSSPGVEVVEADFDDPRSLHRAVDGVRAVFLLTAPPFPTPAHDLALLTAIRDAGVASIVKVSAIGTGERFGGQTVGDWHRVAEDAVRAAGPAWTILRPAGFASNSLRWLPQIRAGVPIPNVTGEGRQGVVDPRDVAAVAAEALTDPAHHGRILTLTGPELLDLPEQVHRLGRVLGRTLATAEVDPQAVRDQMLASGLDPAAVDAVVTGMAWARAGHSAVLTGDVARVLGRPPATFEAWAAGHRRLFGDDQGRSPANRSSSGVGAPVVSRTRT